MLFWLGKGLLLLGLGAAIGLMWGVSAAANVAHAYQLAGASPYAHAFAAASLGADVFKAAAAIGIFYCASQRKWGPAVACLAIWSVTTFWSVRSLIGFSSTLVTEQREIKSERLRTTQANEADLRAEIAAGVHQLAWLRPQMTTAVKGANKEERDSIRGERQTSLEAAERLERRIDELRYKLQQQTAMATQSGVVVADPVGRFLAGHGFSNMLGDLATVVGFLLVVEISSNIALLAFGPLFAGAAPAVRHLSAPEIIPPAPAPTPLKPTPVRAPPRRLGSGLAEIQRGRARSVDNKRAQASAYCADLVALHGAGAIISSVDVLNAYPGWAEREGVSPLLPNQVGQQLGCVGVAKMIRDGHLHYVLPSEEEVAA